MMSAEADRVVRQLDRLGSPTTFTGKLARFAGTAWEDVGHPLPEDASVAETLKAAELDWQVLRLPLFTKHGLKEAQYDEETDEFLGYLEKGDPVEREVEDAFCLMRDSDQQILTPYIGSRYKPVQNEDAFSIFHDFINAGSMTMETAGSICQGRHVWGLARTGYGFQLADGENIVGYFLLTSSFAYGTSLKAMFTPIRFPGGTTVINQRPIPVRQKRNKPDMKISGVYRFPHSRIFDDQRQEEIKQVLEISRAALTRFQDDAKFLSSVGLTEEKGVYICAQVFRPTMIVEAEKEKRKLPTTFAELGADENAGHTLRRIAKEITDYPGAELSSCRGVETAWGLFNSISNTLDNKIGRSADTRLKSAWFGAGSKKKLKAFDLTMAVATASGTNLTAA